MRLLIEPAAYWWLGPPSFKYWASAVANWSAWNKPFSEVVAKYDLGLQNCREIQEVVNAFRGRVFWKPDPLLQIYDLVSPPDTILQNQGDDCDGNAMLHAQAIEYALNWPAKIISYLAKPFWLSHHFTAVSTPNGQLRVVQPQPREIDVKTGIAVNPLLEKTFFTYEGAAKYVASLYNAEVVWFDVRDSKYRL